ncbi:MAG: hypothetical protein A2V70_10100 [Planctomycetes bacterium RBG_13_63_9]|nr:MAG: hypothetical protein A2V70_10100 [Planctomycetes bacterium RBG_13_63_9]
MLDIDGTPNLVRNIRLMRDALGIRDVVIVIGHLGDTIREYLGDGSTYGVNIKYVENTELEKGLAYSVLLAKDYIDGDFCMILSDECYVDSNHEELRSFPHGDAIATCAVMREDDPELIRRNYSVEVDGRRIVQLVEKPKEVHNDLLGTGTFVFRPRIFHLLEKAFVENDMQYVDFVTFINDLIQNGERALCFNLTGSYANINNRDSLQLARYHERSKSFEQKTISLVIYSEGDEKDVAFTIKRYRGVERIERIYVVVPHDNRIEDLASECGAEIIRCPPEIQLYGEKLKYAMECAAGDVLILTEADYSFSSGDVAKLLSYLPEADMVVGTRTTRQLIEQGSTMRGVVRMANVFLAKLLEVLWWKYEARLTDVGCTFRAIWRTTFLSVRQRLATRGPEFATEMIIEVLAGRGRVIEIPVNYFNRSQSMHRKYQNIGTFFRILRLIVRKRLGGLVGKKRTKEASLLRTSTDHPHTAWPAEQRPSSARDDLPTRGSKPR